VTAGVYLIIRFGHLFNSRSFLIKISLLTMFKRSLRALYEADIKKIIAQSTLSQLGLIMFRISIGLKDLAFFHLLSHALFKSLIFLCGGSYIHFFNNRQDSRLILRLPGYSNLTCIYFLYANISLIGAFFISGFYSKDAIIEKVSETFTQFTVYSLLYLSILFTVLYTIRLIKNCSYLIIKNIKLVNSSRETSSIYRPIALLFILTIMGGRVIT